MEKRERYLILGISFLVAALAIFLLYHKKNIRCLLIDSDSSFTKVAPDIYVSNNTPQEWGDSLLELKVQAQEKLTSFWGPLQNNAILIYCHGQANYDKLGAENTMALCRLGRYLVVPSYGLQADVISHELCHTEIFSRIGRNYFKYYQKLPCWLDEGIALQFDDLEINNLRPEEQGLEITDKDLEAMDRPKDFYTDNIQQTLFNYRRAKAEIKRFIERNGKSAIIQTLDQLKNNENWYSNYLDLRK